MQIVIATTNPHKLGEMLQILPALDAQGRQIEYLSLKQFPAFKEVEESGATLEENAVLKAVAARDFTGLASLADDTGLIVDFLGGAPGVLSARYAGPQHDYKANNEKLLRELEAVPFESRTARFMTVSCLALPRGTGDVSHAGGVSHAGSASHAGSEIICREGSVEGHIADGYRGEGGFGYDPLFIVKELGKTMAELTPDEKNQISHRYRSLTAMAQIIQNLVF